MFKVTFRGNCRVLFNGVDRAWTALDVPSAALSGCLFGRGSDGRGADSHSGHAVANDLRWLLRKKSANCENLKRRDAWKYDWIVLTTLGNVIHFYQTRSRRGTFSVSWHWLYNQLIVNLAAYLLAKLANVYMTDSANADQLATDNES